MITVTGCYGFIGSHLVRELAKNSADIIVGVDYDVRNYLDDVRNFMFIPADEFYGNLSKFDITYIFHEGAISSTTETNVFKLYEFNTKCTFDLIYYCRDHGIPIQYASSASVYGNPSKDEWHNPNKPVSPINEYAKTKALSDSLTSLLKDQMQIQGLRYFNVYGENERHKLLNNQSSPQYKFKNQLLTKGKITLFEGSENFYRDFIYIGDLIKIKLKCKNRNVSGIFDAGTGAPKSFMQVAAEICEQEGANIASSLEFIPFPDELKSHYQLYSCANMSWL